MRALIYRCFILISWSNSMISSISFITVTSSRLMWPEEFYEDDDLCDLDCECVLSMLSFLLDSEVCYSFNIIFQKFL